MSRSFGVTIDCADPGRLAVFWREVLGYVDDPPPAGFESWAAHDSANGVSPEEANAGATIVDPAGQRPRVYFQRVPERKSLKNRVHLDVTAGSNWPAVLGAVAQVIAAGGRQLRESADPDDRFMVMADPEGNEFCLVLGG